jgi:hypothetical protein
MFSMHSFEMTSREKTLAFAASEDAFETGGLHAAAEDVLKPWALEKNFNIAQALTKGTVSAFFDGRPQNLRAVLRTFNQKGFFKQTDFADGICHVLCNALSVSDDPAASLRDMNKNGMDHSLGGVDQFPLNNMLLCYATRFYEMNTAPGEKQKFGRVIDAVLQVGTNWDFLNVQAVRTAFTAADRALLKKFHDAGANFEQAAQSLERQPKSFYDPGFFARTFEGAVRIVTRDPASQANQLRDLDRLFTAEKIIEAFQKDPDAARQALREKENRRPS